MEMILKWGVDIPLQSMMFGNISGNKSNIYERDWSKFDWENFILDYFSVDWEDLLKTDELMLIIQPKYISIKLICY